MAGKPDTAVRAHSDISLRASGFRDDFRFCRHLIIPATAIVFLLFPLWGFFTRAAGPVMDLLPVAALGWLCLGVIAASTLHTRRLAESPRQG